MIHDFHELLNIQTRSRDSKSFAPGSAWHFTWKRKHFQENKRTIRSFSLVVFVQLCKNLSLITMGPNAGEKISSGLWSSRQDHLGSFRRILGNFFFHGQNYQKRSERERKKKRNKISRRSRVRPMLSRKTLTLRDHFDISNWRGSNKRGEKKKRAKEVQREQQWSEAHSRRGNKKSIAGRERGKGLSHHLGLYSFGKLHDFATNVYISFRGNGAAASP